MNTLFNYGLVLLLATTSALAQMSGARLSGTVKDSSGAAISQANVTVTNEETGVSSQTNSGNTGLFIFRDLPPGRYDLHIEHAGFQTRADKGIELQVGQDLGYNVALQVGSTSEKIDVTAETPLVETQKSQVDSVITHKQLEDIPTNSRYFLDLAQLAPGVSVNQGTNLGEGLSVNGQRGFANSYNMDGVNNQDAYLQSVRTSISQDAIQEFQILTHQMEPQYGQASGAVVNVATRSGTNEVHGTAYGFFRNSVFDAQNAIDKQYDNPKPDTHREIYGGTVGGPIVKDKLFYFGAYERNRDASSSTITAPQEAGQQVALGPTNQTYFGRVDYNLEKNTFSFRYTGQHSSSLGGPGGVNLLSTEYSEIYKSNNIGASWNHVFSSTTLGEFRAEFSNVADVGVPATASGPGVSRPSSYDGKLTSLPFNVPEYTGQALYNLSMTRGSHDIKVGLDYSRDISDGSNRNFGDGIYYFDTDAPYNAADPSTFPYRYYQRIGPSSWNIPENVIGTFAQDKWRIRQNLVLTYGLRYDYESFFSDVPGTATVTGARIPNATKNFQPRVGVAYSPWGDKTVFRAGAGMFYSRIPLNEASLIIVNTVNTLQGQIINLLDPAAIPFPNPPTGGAIPENSTAIDVLDNHLKVQRTDQYSIGMTHQLTNRDSIDIDAVRALGSNLWTLVNRNAPDPVTGIRPLNPAYNAISAQSSIGHSWYSDLEVSYKHRSSHADLTLAYTFSRAIDDIRGDPNGPGVTCSQLINGIGNSAIRCDRGPSNNDIPQHFVANGTFTLPWNIRYSTILNFQSAPAYSETAGTDLNGDDYTNERPLGVARNSLRADKYFSWDMRLGKRFVFKERYAAELFAETFNITNTANYNGYIGNVLSTQFEQPTGASDPRRMQFGFRFSF